MHFESKVDLCHKSNIEYIGLVDFSFTIRYTKCNLPIIKPFDSTLFVNWKVVRNFIILRIKPVSFKTTLSPNIEF